MNEKPGCPGTAAKLPYIPGNQKLTPPSSAHELFVDKKTEITNTNALNKRRTLDAMNRMRLIVVMARPLKAMPPKIQAAQLNYNWSILAVACRTHRTANSALRQCATGISLVYTAVTVCLMFAHDVASAP